MLKRILLAALMWPLLALAQSYPSPTFNNVTVNGTLTNTNGISLASLAQQAANTVLANATGSTANITAFAMPSCSTSASALNWTSSSGFTCNTSVNAAQLNGATFASPPAAGYGSTTPQPVSATTITATTPIGVASGGTGRATLTAHGVLVGEGTSAINQLAVGTTGQVLVGATGADPAFGSSVGALTFTAAITPSSTAGIVGTTTNDSANAGSFGEYISNSASSVALTSGTSANITTISLTAGDWDVSGMFQIIPAAGTSPTIMQASITQTSATQGPLGTGSFLTLSFPSGASQAFALPTQRISLASSATVYLVGVSVFSGGTLNGAGFLRARRVR